MLFSASFDGRVSVYSLMGGQQQVQPNTRVTDSFGPGLGDIPGQNVPTPQVTMQLKSPPKWLRRPCGASFGFGGKLVTCETVSGERGQIYLSRVVTEPGLVESSSKLETSLSEGNYEEFCQAKLGSLDDEDKSKIWQFIGASFKDQVDQEFLSLLGIELTELSSQLRTLLKPTKQEQNGDHLSPGDNLASNISGLNLDVSQNDTFDMIAKQAPLENTSLLPTSLDTEFSLKRDISSTGGQMTVALLAGDIELAVDIALQQKRFAEALILAIRGGGDLLARTQAKYFQQAAKDETHSESVALVEAVALDDWSKLVTNARLESWREVLAAVLTYTDQHTKYVLAGQLGDRLMSLGDHSVQALLCYLVAGDLDKLVMVWMKLDKTGLGDSPGSLQELVELAVLSRAAVSRRGLAQVSSPGGELSAALAQYASLLASQGSLSAALSYLPDDAVAGDKKLTELKERLQKALSGRLFRNKIV